MEGEEKRGEEEKIEGEASGWGGKRGEEEKIEGEASGRGGKKGRRREDRGKCCMPMPVPR